MGALATCPALPRARKSHLLIKAGLGPRRSASYSQFCPTLLLWPGGDRSEGQPAGVVAPRPISVQASCANQKHLLERCQWVDQGCWCKQLSWREGGTQLEAQLGLGGLGVTFANRGKLLPFSPLPLINKKNPPSC